MDRSHVLSSFGLYCADDKLCCLLHLKFSHSRHDADDLLQLPGHLAGNIGFKGGIWARRTCTLKLPPYHFNAIDLAIAREAQWAKQADSHTTRP